MENEAKTGGNIGSNVLLPFVSAHPVRSTFVMFFYALGITRAIDDLAHHALGWHLTVGDDYLIALTMTVTGAFIVPWLLPPGISSEQREAEKKILAQAANIDRAAQNADGTK